MRIKLLLTKNGSIDCSHASPPSCINVWPILWINHTHPIDFSHAMELTPSLNRFCSADWFLFRQNTVQSRKVAREWERERERNTEGRCFSLLCWFCYFKASLLIRNPSNKRRTKFEDLSSGHNKLCLCSRLKIRSNVIIQEFFCCCSGDEWFKHESQIKSEAHEKKAEIRFVKNSSV